MGVSNNYARQLVDTARAAIELQERQSEAIEQVRVRVLPDGRMARTDAARYLGRAEKTLAMWALKGLGPRMVKVGGRCFYYRQDLDAFINAEAS